MTMGWHQTCILNTTGTLYEFGRCNSSRPGSSGQIPRASRNVFFVPGGAAPGNASFQCGSKELSLTEAQEVGYEEGSVSKESTTLSPDAIQELIGKFLGYRPNGLTDGPTSVP